MMEKMDMKSLSDSELMEAFLPSQSVASLLREYSSPYDIVLHTPLDQLGRVAGVGDTRLRRLMYFREIMERIQKRRQQDIKVIHGPEDVMQYFSFLQEHLQEEFWVLLLNTKNHVIKSQQITIGTIAASLVEPREIFKTAVEHLAASLIVTHNHPSGIAEPSSEDIEVTRRLVKAGKVMHIPVLDHVIIGKYGSYSLKEHNQRDF